MNFKRIAAMAAAVMLALLTFILSACGDTAAAKLTVKFDYNDGFTPEKTVEVESGSTVQEPSAPERSGFKFIYWYASGSGTAYDFTAPVTQNITLLAKWEIQYRTVTIDYNYDGKTEEESVVDSEVFERPEADPEREGFTFEGWFADKNCLTAYNFAKPVTEDVTIYAKWLEVNATYYKVSFNYNYTGSPAAKETDVKEGEKAVKPEDPVRGGFTFDGWYKQEACTEKFDFNSAITEDTEIFAGWIEVQGVKTYKFEAELTDISKLEGTGYSSEAKGKDMIQREAGNKPEASNGFWIGYMYANGNTLTFNFESAAAVTDATLKLRLSAEFVNELVLNCNDFTVELNGKKIEYSDIHISDIDAGISAAKHPFKDFTVGENLELKQGINTVTLKVTNSKPMTGTNGIAAGGKIAATAPLIDCIKVTTTATLSWTPYTDALTSKYSWWDFDEYEGIVEE